jgi:hypothetical protein
MRTVIVRSQTRTLISHRFASLLMRMLQAEIDVPIRSDTISVSTVSLSILVQVEPKSDLKQPAVSRCVSSMFAYVLIVVSNHRARQFQCLDLPVIDDGSIDRKSLDFHWGVHSLFGMSRIRVRERTEMSPIVDKQFRRFFKVRTEVRWKVRFECDSNDENVSSQSEFESESRKSYFSQ